MLNINGLYKEKKGISIKDLDLTVDDGSSVSIECGNEISDMLFGLILGREIPGRGSIRLDDSESIEYAKRNGNSIGVVPREDTLYENMTIEGYLKFFSGILGSAADYKEIIYKLALVDTGKTKIKHLTRFQKRRVSLARERLKQPRLMLLQDLILDLDRDETKIMIENIDELCGEGAAVINTSCVFKNALMLGQRTYRLDSAGLTELFGSGEEADISKSSHEENKTYKIEKIPAKIDERILLFDPNEIDYIESEQGVNLLYIRGEKFPCAIPLSDLEERIRCFGFFRSHRSYLVNLQRVREVVTWTRNSYSLNLDDKIKSSIPLSKGRLEDLKAILNF